MSNELIPTLDFDETFQRAVIGHMFEDPVFFNQCNAFILPGMFAFPYHKRIVDRMYRLYREGKNGQNRQVPTRDEVEAVLATEFFDSTNKSAHHRELDEIQAMTKRISLYIVQRHMTGWMKGLKIKELYNKSGPLFNDKRFEEAAELIDSLVEDIRSISFSPSEAVSFLDLKKFYEDREMSLSDHCCTIGHGDFDELISRNSKLNYVARPGDRSVAILRGSTRGSLAPGGTTVILGATNSGKTTFLVSIIVANLFLGKRVLLITHEQLQEDIKAKLVECIMGKSTQQIQSEIKSNPIEMAAKMVAAERLLQKYLTYIPWIKVGAMYVENVIAIIQHHQEILKATLKAENLKQLQTCSPDKKAYYEKLIEENRGFDLVIDDYPRKLRAKQFRNQAKSEHDEIQYVYAQFVDCARQEGNRFHCITPAQGNREAFKVSTRGDQDRMLDLGDGAGSFGLMHEVDNVISINRYVGGAVTDKVKFYLTKCRLNATGSTFVTTTQMECSKMIGYDLFSKAFPPGTMVDDQTLVTMWGDMVNKQKQDEIDARMKKGLEQKREVEVGPVLEPKKPEPVDNPKPEPELAMPVFGLGSDGKTPLLDPEETEK